MTIDVECLYNISHKLGIQVIKTYLEKMGQNSQQYNTFIIHFITFILTDNFFLFHGSLLLQVQGVVIGTSCAPSYTNLYLGERER